MSVIEMAAGSWHCTRHSRTGQSQPDGFAAQCCYDAAIHETRHNRSQYRESMLWDDQRGQGS